MDALLVGELITSSQGGLAIKATDGTVTEILWPFGYSARREALDLVLLDERGVVVARQGNMIEMGGGLGGNDVWEACAGSINVTGIRMTSRSRTASASRSASSSRR